MVIFIPWDPNPVKKSQIQKKSKKYKNSGHFGGGRFPYYEPQILSGLNAIIHKPPAAPSQRVCGWTSTIPINYGWLRGVIQSFCFKGVTHVTQSFFVLRTSTWKQTYTKCLTLGVILNGSKQASFWLKQQSDLQTSNSNHSDWCLYCRCPLTAGINVNQAPRNWRQPLQTLRIPHVGILIHVCQRRPEISMLWVVYNGVSRQMAGCEDHSCSCLSRQTPSEEHPTELLLVFIGLH